VFDLNNKNTFLHIQDWIDEISKFTGPNISKLVIGNKCDIPEDSIKVSDDDIKEFENKTGIKVIKVSAKSSLNVDLAFRTIVENLIVKKYNFFKASVAQL